jgi:hypothetical protein
LQEVFNHATISKQIIQNLKKPTYYKREYMPTLSGILELHEETFSASGSHRQPRHPAIDVIANSHLNTFIGRVPASQHLTGSTPD